MDQKAHHWRNHTNACELFSAMVWNEAPISAIKLHQDFTAKIIVAYLQESKGKKK